MLKLCQELRLSGVNYFKKVLGILPKMTTTEVTAILLTLFTVSLCQLPSPCPEIFRYDSKTEDDRWYGILTLNTKRNIIGVTIYIKLDSPAALMGNWFAAVTTTDNTNFEIQNTTYRFRASTPLTVKFFVRHDGTKIPSLERIIFNGEIICTASEPTTSPSPTSTTQVTTSSREPTTSPSPTSPRTQVTASPSKPTSTVSSSKDTISNSKGSLNPNAGSKVRPRSDTPSCGTAVPVPNALVIDGQNTVPGQWPWYAALYHLRDKSFQYKCGGTLISTKHVITAAHCVTARFTTLPLSPRIIIVYLGKYHFIEVGSEVQNRNVEKIYVHPQYNASLQLSDIAIIEFSNPFDITNSVRPCCLWEDEDKDITGKQGTVVGWDFDSNLEFLSNYLKKVQLAVVSTLTCVRSYSSFFSMYASEEYFCAGFGNGTSVCNGDSGSGMVFPKKGTSGPDTVWQLRGIVSVGVPQNGQSICNTSQYVVFTDVANYTTWISDIIK